MKEISKRDRIRELEKETTRIKVAISRSGISYQGKFGYTNLEKSEGLDFYVDKENENSMIAINPHTREIEVFKKEYVFAGRIIQRILNSSGMRDYILVK